MIERLMSLNHFTYKKPFSGSDKGGKFKYIIKMIEEEIKEEGAPEDAKPTKIKKFSVVCWHGVNNSKATSEEDKLYKEFEFSEEGYKQALKWLNDESDKSV